MVVKVAKNNKGSGRKKVWHITDFRELFELSDDLRKNRPGPLTYTKSVVTLTAGSKEHDIKHFERLEELKSRQERHLLRSIFEDVKNWSGKKIIRHRGFLLTTSEQPASYDYLAGQLKIDVEELKKIMPILEEIGLIERVEMSVFQGNQPAKKKSKSKAKKTPGRKKQKSKSAAKKSKPDASGCVRTKPDTSGTKRKPLYNSTKHNHKKKSNETKDKTNGNDKAAKEKNDGNTKRIDNSNAQEEHGRKAENATLVPKVADEGGSVIPFHAPPGSVNNNTPQRIGDIAKGLIHRYDPDARTFGGEIYRSLKLPWDPTSFDGRREVGNFAKAWMKTKNTGIPPPALDKLWNRAVDVANKIAKKRPKYSNPARVWRGTFNKLLSTKCSEYKCKAM